MLFWGARERLLVTSSGMCVAVANKGKRASAGCLPPWSRLRDLRRVTHPLWAWGHGVLSALHARLVGSQLGEDQLALTARSSQCSVSCGAGVRRRSVTCRGDEGSLLHATACSLEDRPTLTEPCVHDACPPLGDQAWHVGAWGLVSTAPPASPLPAPPPPPTVESGSLGLMCRTRHPLPPALWAPPSLRVSSPMRHSLSLPPGGPQCSKSCSSGTRRRQVVCALGPPGHCGSLQLSKPAAVEACNTQPCDLPPGKDGRGSWSLARPLALPATWPALPALAPLPVPSAPRTTLLSGLRV